MELAQAKLRELSMQFGAPKLARIEEMLRVRNAEAQCKAARFQKPWLLQVPGLTARPWHDPARFRWSSVVPRFFPSISDELYMLLQDGVSQPYTEQFNEHLHGLPRRDNSPIRTPSSVTASKESWTAFHLYRAGLWLTINSRVLPAARALIEQTPYAPGEALCSVLEPRSSINLHTGGCNIVLTCHLPLIVPGGCGLQVGAESRSFETGKLVIFDDSFWHRAWNKSSSRRINLLWEIWHPGLTAAEVQALSVLYPLLMEFD